MRVSLLKSPLSAVGELRETEAVTSLVYEVVGTLCYESKSVVLLGSLLLLLSFFFLPKAYLGEIGSGGSA